MLRRSLRRAAVGQFPRSDDFLYINDNESRLRWVFGLGSSVSAAHSAPVGSPPNAVITFVQPLGILRRLATKRKSATGGS